MTLIIAILLNILPRPECPPLTVADLRRYFTLEQRFNTQTPTEKVELPMRHAIPGRLVIGFRPQALCSVISRLEAINLRIILIDTTADFIVVHLPPNTQVADYEKIITSFAGIRFVEPDFWVYTLLIPNDPMFSTVQWDKWVMYSDPAWDIVTGGNIKVAVVDNGVEYLHPDLAANFRAGELGYDFIGNDNDPRPDNPTIENAFHGTHVSGIIAGIIGNQIGIAGWAQVQLLAVRVLNDSGNGTLTDVARGIRWAADNGAIIINLSIGGDAVSTPLLEACQYAVRKGALLVAASGNDGKQGITYPAKMAECIAVGATDATSELAWFSNYGPELELVAPGTTIYSTVTGGYYGSANGTSMATPQVSGVAALLFALNPSFTANQVRAILSVSAIDMGANGRDAYFGYGLVNAYRAVQLAQSLLTGSTTKSIANLPTLPTIINHRTLSLPLNEGIISIYNSTGRRIFKSSSPDNKINLTEPGTYFLRINLPNSSPTIKKITVIH